MSAFRISQGSGSPRTIVRTLHRQDWVDWIDLRQALWPHHDRPSLETEAHEIAAHQDSTPVFVATEPTGRLIGMLEVSIRNRAPGCKTERIGYLEGWFVAPSWRGRGIGRQLVLSAERWAREHGCTEMASDTNDRYPESPPSHEALGSKPVRIDIHFRKSLDEETP